MGEKIQYKSTSELLTGLFDKELADQVTYDSEVVAIIRKHLGQNSIHSRAGYKLSEELAELGKRRVKEKRQ
jgi:hypothetical protein